MKTVHIVEDSVKLRSGSLKIRLGVTVRDSPSQEQIEPFSRPLNCIAQRRDRASGGLEKIGAFDGRAGCNN